MRFVAAEVDAYRVGERTLAARLYPRLRADELLTADRGFYSWAAWDDAAVTGAAAEAGVKVLVWREAEVRAVFSLAVSAADAVEAAKRLVALAAATGPRRRAVLVSPMGV